MVLLKILFGSTILICFFMDFMINYILNNLKEHEVENEIIDRKNR